MNPTLQLKGTRPRDSARERRERLRFQVLREIYDRARARCDVLLSGQTIREALRISREDAFRSIYDLEHRGFLSYRGAGPRICITEKGISYLEREAGRRRSIRDG